jgi:hypothetical protein
MRRLALWSVLCTVTAAACGGTDEASDADAAAEAAAPSAEDVPTYYATVVDTAVHTIRGPNLQWGAWDTPPIIVTSTSAPAIATSACDVYDVAYQRQDGRFTRVKVQ